MGPNSTDVVLDFIFSLFTVIRASLPSAREPEIYFNWPLHHGPRWYHVTVFLIYIASPFVLPIDFPTINWKGCTASGRRTV